MEMPKEVAFILSTIEGQGYEAYIVGGCVRDKILGVEPKDWDITSSALPEQIKKLFARTVDTGIEHGTVTVLLHSVPYEVTTYRLDGTYSDGRHPDKVTFSPLLTEDLKRRDFTINAMAYSRKSGLVDLFEGVEDLERGLVRCVGQAKERFAEDALRMLRAVRFAAQLGFRVEADTEAAIRVMAANLSKVSKERIWVELCKTLCAPHPEKIQAVFDYGLHSYIGEHFSALSPVDFSHMDRAAELQAEKHIRWAYFLQGTDAKEAVAVLKELKSDRDTAEKVRKLLSFLQKRAESAMELKLLLYELGAELTEDLLQLQRAAGLITGEHYEALQRMKGTIIEEKQPYCLSMLALDGKDLVAAGFSQGPYIGKLLFRLLRQTMEGKVENRRESLLAAAEAFADREGGAAEGENKN